MENTNNIEYDTYCSSKTLDKKPVYTFFKRLFDIFFSFISIIILSPLFLIIAIAIKIDDFKGPVIYVSDRVGKNGIIFKFYKFRSMCVDADTKYQELQNKNETDGPIFKMKEDPRVTKVGKLLRKTSLDELPQLFNIIKGDMSFVGPRPPLLREVENYPEYPMERLSVPGGLSCYWQIYGRSSIGFNDMVKFDLKYIEDRSLLTDLKILFLTIPAVLKNDGAY